jgi:hypothetical protein
MVVIKKLNYGVYYVEHNNSRPLSITKILEDISNNKSKCLLYLKDGNDYIREFSRFLLSNDIRKYNRITLEFCFVVETYEIQNIVRIEADNDIFDYPI